MSSGIRKLVKYLFIRGKQVIKREDYRTGILDNRDRHCHRPRNDAKGRDCYSLQAMTNEKADTEFGLYPNQGFKNA